MTTATATTRPTWDELIAIEPGLAALLAEVRRERPGRRYCANARWFGHAPHRGEGFKPRMERLVGWRAEGGDPRLRTAAAYDAAYRTLYDALPGCRGCACPSLPDLLGRATDPDRPRPGPRRGRDGA